MKPLPSSLVISRQKRKSLKEFVKMGFWIPLALLLMLLTFVLTLRAQASSHVTPSTTGTVQDFDLGGVGTPYSVFSVVAQNPPVYPTGGPTGTGKFARLAFQTSPQAHNSLAFDRTDAGAFDLVVADFDFRLKVPTVSYTHLDVYKRQVLGTRFQNS